MSAEPSAIASSSDEAAETVQPSQSNVNSNRSTPPVQTDSAGPIPSKIPPPPTELPPPYTPFAVQSSLLPSSNHAGQEARVTNRRTIVIKPPGIRRYFEHLTPLNLLIFFIAIIALGVFIYIIHRSNLSDEDRTEPLEGTHKLLRFINRPLGEFKNSRGKISFDERANKIILSEFDPDANLLKSEVKDLADHLSEYKYLEDNVSGKYNDCMKLSEGVYCCSTSSHSRHHKTNCFLTANDTKISSVASKYDFTHDWQSLDDDEKLLILYNPQRHAVLDLKNHKIYKIEENLLPHGYYSVSFFFPMDTADELDELVRKDDEFRICEYLKTDTGDYVLKEKKCEPTAFKYDYELPNIRFCTNPLYTAVIQYGHLKGEQVVLTWRLRVKYDSAPEIYSATESLESQMQQVAIDCNDDELVVFAVGSNELHEFAVKLPDLRSEHFIQTRQF